MSVHLLPVVVAVTSSCAFPYKYQYKLYYSCIDDISSVSPDDETSACLDHSNTAILCDISPGSYKPRLTYFSNGQNITFKMLLIFREYQK